MSQATINVRYQVADKRFNVLQNFHNFSQEKKPTSDLQIIDFNRSVKR